MKQERRKGFILSATFHALIFLFAIVGLPSLLNPPPDEPMAIVVDILPISEMTNVKPAEPQPEAKKPEEPKEDKQSKKPQPPVKTTEAPPPPPEKLSTKKEKEPDKKKEEKKPEDKKDDKKTKPKEDDLAAVLKAVRETAQKQKEAEKGGEKSSKAQSEQYNPSLPLSMTEMDVIRSQIAKCWNVPAGAKDAQDLRVVLKIQLNQDGSLIKVELASESKDRYGSDSFFRAAADSAMRAVRQCSPLQNLPAEKYQTWRDMELTFDPKEMLF